MKAFKLLIIFFLCVEVFAQPTYNIIDFGAKPDESVMNTRFIQSAIDSCFKTGGGTVVIPPGTFYTGTLHFKNNVSVKLTSGSVLKGSPNISDYPGERKALIKAVKLSDIIISGKGTIDGNGYAFWNEDWTYNERPSPCILFQASSNITIRDIKIINSPSHTIRIEGCKDFKFDGLSIINPQRSQNTDGIDIVDSKFVTISNCYMSSGDDLICLKSHEGPVEYVTVTNCILESDDAAIKFGTGGDVAIRYCTFNNVVMKDTRYGIAFFMLTGGIYEHNRFSNMIIENGGRHKYVYPLFIDIDKRLPEHSYGKIENNVFENIKIVTSGKFLITGHPEQYINGLTLRDIDMTVVDEVSYENAKKPRGNKKYPQLETSQDLSQQKAHVVLGNIKSLRIDNFNIDAQESNRTDFYKVETTDQM